MDDLKTALTHPNFRLIEADIRDRNVLNSSLKNIDFEIVFHLAAKAGVRPSIIDPQGYYETNVMGTLNILELMKEKGVNKMIFASSSSVYGNNLKTPFAENDAVDCPISPYAATKKAGELLCHTYAYLYGFDIFCLRFFTVYGPRQRPDLAIHKFTNLILNNLPVPVYGDGSTSRDYTYIDDIISGVVSSAGELRGYEVINLGESKTITLNEMISAIEKRLRKTAIRAIHSMQQGDVFQTYADIEKAERLLGYKPKWSFEDGIQKFLEWKKGS